ncbi:granzyme H-like isoform X2 [Myotis lucifugus]|uniref:granzyme H-like isoform X2 n=1 Tax=Myotis lucifugus TaxID=59463 RepID=UPI000CCC487C|nr:granzyme H-like isoform X2 [Myotis lucifugus]
MQPLLLLLAFLLAPKAQAVKIIGGHEVKPHSRPYMAFLRIRNPGRKRCGGFLVRGDFVLTAAHCWGRSITVILGAHNIRKRERTQQVIPVKTAIRHPNYHPKVNDIMLLQLQRKATLTAAVSLLRLPRRGEQGDSGGPLVCDHMAQGIVAFGKKNGKPPRVETKISSFLPWIKRTMRRFQLQRPD